MKVSLEHRTLNLLASPTLARKYAPSQLATAGSTRNVLLITTGCSPLR
jgi:hypothetical protein